jgi:hypothetical protein
MCFDGGLVAALSGTSLGNYHNKFHNNNRLEPIFKKIVLCFWVCRISAGHEPVVNRKCVTLTNLSFCLVVASGR